MELKVGDRVQWSNSNDWSQAKGQEVGIIWIADPPALNYSKDGSVVLIDVPGREYYRRFVLVPARVLNPVPKPCPAKVRLDSAPVFHSCSKLEGHPGFHNCEVNTWVRGERWGTETLRKIEIGW